MMLPPPHLDNLTPVGSKKLCFSPRSNFPESEWRSYSRFTNERKSLCFDSQSDFDLRRANTRGILGALGADVAQRQNTRRAPEMLHLIYFGCLKKHIGEQSSCESVYHLWEHSDAANDE